MGKILRYITPNDNYHVYDNHLMALHTSHFERFFGASGVPVPFEFKIHFTDCLLFIHMWIQANDPAESVGPVKPLLRYKYENCREFLLIWEKKFSGSANFVDAASSDFVNAGESFSKLIDNKNYDHLLLRPFTAETNNNLFATGLLFPYNKVTELMLIFKNLANGVFAAAPLSTAPLSAWSRL